MTKVNLHFAVKHVRRQNERENVFRMKDTTDVAAVLKCSVAVAGCEIMQSLKND